MTKKTKKALSVLLIGLLALSLAACGTGSSAAAPAGTTAAANKEPIKIGETVALTGGNSLWGQSEKMALDMEIERINAAGGVMGRPLELVAYDNKADQTEGVNVAKRLIGDKVVAIIGPAQSGVGIAAASVTEPAKMIMIGTTTTNTKLTVNDDGSVKPYTFRTCFIDPYQGKVAATFALNSLKVTKAAILMDIGSDYSQGLSQYFKETFEAGGGKVVAQEAFRSEELDYRAQLGKIKDAGAELLFIPTMQKEAGLAMKQAKDLGLNVKFLGGDGWASKELIELGGEATEGSYYVNIASLEDPTIADWVKAYREKYKMDPVMPNPVLAVDALRMICKAIEATGGTDSTAMAEYISKMSGFEGLTGKITMDPKTHNPVNKPAVIETVKNGQFAFYEAFAGQ
jgi:branched-chain amino acid transport system substrate-binding protein